MTIIPIQLKDAEVAKIDYLVKKGKFKSRNQAIRQFLTEALAREEFDLTESDLITTEERERFFQSLDNSPTFSLTLKGKKSIADVVSKERDRFT